MENINIAGSGKISGGEYAQVKISGSGRVLGNIRCTDLRSAGSAHVEGDVECAGQIKCAGSFRCDGRVQADELHVIGSIGGGEILVERGDEKNGFFGLFRKNGTGTLSVSTIEGDSVTLQNTEADVVRGREVVISSGCKIGCVEYSVSLKVEDDGQVGERRQV